MRFTGTTGFDMDQKGSTARERTLFNRSEQESRVTANDNADLLTAQAA